MKNLYIIFAIIILLFPTSFVLAADDVWTIPDVQIKIPGLNFSSSVDCSDNGDGTKTCKVPFIAEYIAAIYKYAIGIVGILAVVVMMWGGVRWMTAGGNASGIGEARSWITAALTGLVLVLGSYTILYFVNPNLTNLKSVEIKTIKKAPETSTKTRISSCHGKAIETVVEDLNAYKDKSCGAGEQKVENFYCSDITDSTKDYVCCCSTNNTWAFQSGISSQKNDASPQLTGLIDCMRKYLPSGVGEISSISDSHHIGSLTDCHRADCKAYYGSGATSCQHACFSCHYGGDEYKQSYAVDFGDENNADLILDVAKNKCGDFYGFGQLEENHVHISTNLCSRN